MIINRYYKYRIYPTKEQEKLLLSWEATLRFLWNICNEQRLLGLARDKEHRIYMRDIHKDKNLSQNKQMTDLLETYPWIAEVQCQARQQVLSDLDKAWQRVFKKLSKRVKFKSKKDAMSICIPVASVPFKLSGDRLTGKLSFIWGVQYKKLAPLKIVYIKLIDGTVKSWTIKKEIDEWYAFACVEKDIVIPEPIDKTVGIDRGVVNVIADSDGRLIANPKLDSKMEQQLIRAQRQVAKKKKGSNNQKKAYKKLAKLQRRLKRQREVFIGTQSLYYAENYGTVVVEDLNIPNMTASVKGTIDNPGKNVKQKSRLNAAILDVAWGKFADATKYKLEERGGKLVKVKPAYSSQTCPECNNIDHNNRISQDQFKCSKCSFEGKSDTIAAIVIKKRGTDNSFIKKPKEKQTLFNRRRQKKLTTVEPTVVQPAEDNSIASSIKIDDQEPDETGTKISDGLIVHHQMFDGG